MSTALIIGGTSGLGLELAHIFACTYDRVFVTGRSMKNLLDNSTKRRGNKNISFRSSCITKDSNVNDLNRLLSDLPKIDLLIYAAGFRQRAPIDELSDDDIATMAQVGLTFPALLLRRILSRQDDLPGFIAITSTSEYVPRREEPVYAATKAGLGMLARSVALDERVGKVLIAAPAGMKTPFWDGHVCDMSTFLDPARVAMYIFNIYADLYRSDAKCQSVKILRQPERVEFVEQV